MLSKLSSHDKEITKYEGHYKTGKSYTIKSKTYYVTNEKNGTIYSVTTDGDIGDEVGKYVDGKPVFK
jgi:hypothetical protein